MNTVRKYAEWFEEAAMRILVMGGDGHFGWPSALHLSAVGHGVCVVNNCGRRSDNRELGPTSLVPIASLHR